MKTQILLLTFLISTSAGFAAIKSGPMLGARDMREASVWLQCDPSEKAVLKYNADGKDCEIALTADADGICKFFLRGLKPASKYQYELLVGGETASGELETVPDIELRTPPVDFSVAIAGQNHVNDSVFDEPFKTPGGDFQIYNAIKDKKPQALIWANNIANFRPADWGSRSGIFARYAFERSEKSLQELLKSVPNYGVIGAASYGAPKSDKRFIGRPDSIAAFKAFWTNAEVPNPAPGASFFRYSDAEFFILDDVSCRNDLEIGDAKREFLGREQMEWLLVSLKNSKVTFKVIVMNSPFLNPVENEGNYIYAKEERKKFLEFILSQKIGGLVFASANKDYGEVTRMVRAGAKDLYEITAGPLTARPAKKPGEVNYFRQTSSAVLQRSFVMLSFGGKEGAREVKLQFFDSVGESIYLHTIKQADLY